MNDKNMTYAAVEDIWPLAPLQSAMLIASLRAPASGVFVQQIVVRLNDPLDAKTFELAWRLVIARTPALRVSFHWKDLEQPIQVVHRDATPSFETLDWSRLDAFDARLAQYLDAGRRNGFDLERPPLLRLAVIRGPAQAACVVWEFHHILFDGWSAHMLMGEVIDQYRALARRSEFSPPQRRSPRHYFDWLAARDRLAAVRYWEGVLRGYRTPVHLQLPPPETPFAETTSDSEVEAALDAQATERLRRFAREHGLTVNTIVQGAWALLLSCHADRDDVVFGAVVAGRPPEVAGIEQMVGLFISAIPVRTRLDHAAALLAWMKDLQAAQAASTPFHFLTGGELQRCSELPAGMALFDTLLVFENFPTADPGRESSAPGLDLARADIPLTLLVVPGRQWLIKCRYDGNRFRTVDMQALCAQLLHLLRIMPAEAFSRLADISLIPEDDYRGLVGAHANAVGPGEVEPVQRLHELAQTRPHDPAFIDAQRTIDFSTLEAASLRLARELSAAGIASGAIVGVCAPRSLEQVVSFFALLRLHAVYMPLDPSYPPHRLSQMLEDVRPAAVLVTAQAPALTGLVLIDISKVLEAATPPHGVDEGRVAWQGDDPAYILFTSGSTGRPKGVLAHWSQIANRLTWMWRAYPFAPDEVACQRTATNFVDSLWELLGAALQGIPTVIVPERTAYDPHALIALLAKHGVSRLWLVPSLLKMLLEAQPNVGRALPRLRFWVSTGEPLAADLFNRFCKAHPAATLFNLYGTSEVWDATWFDPRREAPIAREVPIGRPIDGVRAYILDRNRRLVPYEVPGELYIGGVAVSRGYIRSTAGDECFVPDPLTSHPGARMYRTGDVARRQRDGLIVCMGRRDQQIKLRGVRIEPSDIEAVLRGSAPVRDAVVLLREDSLVAYVAAPVAEYSAPALLARLRDALPEAFLPAAIVRLDALPLTPNGKLDKSALPAPEQARSASNSADLSALELQVQTCFAEVLRVQSPDPDADFFRDLGGHSLLALRVCSRLSQLVECEVPAGTLFDCPTVRSLAAWIAASRTSDAGEQELLAILESLPAAEREALLQHVSETPDGETR